MNRRYLSSIPGLFILLMFLNAHAEAQITVGPDGCSVEKTEYERLNSGVLGETDCFLEADDDEGQSIDVYTFTGEKDQLITSWDARIGDTQLDLRLALTDPNGAFRGYLGHFGAHDYFFGDLKLLDSDGTYELWATHEPVPFETAPTGPYLFVVRLASDGAVCTVLDELTELDRSTINSKAVTSLDKARLSLQSACGSHRESDLGIASQHAGNAAKHLKKAIKKGANVGSMLQRLVDSYRNTSDFFLNIARDICGSADKLIVKARKQLRRGRAAGKANKALKRYSKALTLAMIPVTRTWQGRILPTMCVKPWE